MLGIFAMLLNVLSSVTVTLCYCVSTAELNWLSAIQLQWNTNVNHVHLLYL